MDAFISKVGHAAATGSHDAAHPTQPPMSIAKDPPAGDHDLPQVDSELTLNIDGSVLQNQRQKDPVT